MNATASGLSHDANPDGTDRVVKPLVSKDLLSTPYTSG